MAVSEDVKKYSPTLKLTIVEGMFTSIMTGGAATFIIPFALFLGATSQEVGFLVAFPALIAAFAQLGALKLLKVYKKRRTALTSMVFLQSLSWLLIGLIPFFFKNDQVFALTLIYVVGQVIGSMGSPIWQSWMSSLVPKQIIGEYFGIRNALTGLVVFVTMLLSGLALRFVEPSQTLYVFSGIFIISFLGRFMASILFSKTEDPEFVPEKDSTRFIDFVTQLRKDNFGYFVLFGSLMTFGISLIGPFFSVYLLEVVGLKSDYLTYTLIIAAAALANLISMPYWGKIIDKYGIIKTTKVTGLLASLYPLLLIFVRDPNGLMIIESLSGIIFSGFNLCLASFIYESFRQEKIIKYAGYQAALFGIATFFGIILSGWIQSLNPTIGILDNPFYVICAIAVIVRFTVYTTLVNKIKEVRETKHIKDRTLIIGVLTFEPIRTTFFSSMFTIITLTETLTITGIKTVGGLAKKSITTAENYTKNASKIAEEGIDNVEIIAKKKIENVKEVIKKNRKKGFI
ncbi:MAG: MFS transporter [Candidatus Iainarchaeum sp.]|jgi:MFS family permease